MSKPETLKDIIEETMRVSGVPYKVPVGGVINADSVNHPPHYTFGGIETIEYMKAKSTPEEFKGSLSRLTAIKYSLAAWVTRTMRYKILRKRSPVS
jgi:hypothetical protein